MKHLLAIALLCTSVFADYAKEPAGMPSKEEMAKIKEFTTPGENHAIMKDLVGTWQATVKIKMTKDAPEHTSKATQINKLIMGGRFLQTEHSGTDMEGKPYKGMGLLGFDNVKKEFQSSWIDNMSTSMMTSTGTWDASTKTIAENGSASCPMTGETRKFRTEYKLIDKKNYTYRMWTNDKDGTEFQNMEITYKKS